MTKILKKKDFAIKPEKRFNESKVVIATPSNSKEVYHKLVSDIPRVNRDFFTKDKHVFLDDTDKLQFLFNVSDRTFWNWGKTEDIKPKKNHLAISLLSLDLHPTLRLERR